MNRVFYIYLISAIFLSGCAYTARSTEGQRIAAAQVQQIKLGQTTEVDLLKLLGPPSKKERKADGTEHLIYIHSELKSLTFPGGIVLYGPMDKVEEDIFEVILKNGVVQTYQFRKGDSR